MMGVQPLQLPKIHPQTLHIQPITTPKIKSPLSLPPFSHGPTHSSHLQPQP